jgi:hypothetical protein
VAVIHRNRYSGPSGGNFGGSEGAAMNFIERKDPAPQDEWKTSADRSAAAVARVQDQLIDPPIPGGMRR